MKKFLSLLAVTLLPALAAADCYTAPLGGAQFQAGGYQAASYAPPAADVADLCQAALASCVPTPAPMTYQAPAASFSLDTYGAAFAAPTYSTPILAAPVYRTYYPSQGLLLQRDFYARRNFSFTTGGYGYAAGRAFVPRRVFVPRAGFVAVPVAPVISNGRQQQVGFGTGVGGNVNQQTGLFNFALGGGGGGGKVNQQRGLANFNIGGGGGGGQKVNQQRGLFNVKLGG